MPPHFQIRGLSGALGAEILDLDLSSPLSQRDREDLLAAFYQYGVLCIRDQKLTHESHVALGQVFGDADVHPIAVGLPDYPQIIRVLKPKGEQAFFGTSWHTDNSFFERPSATTILYGEQVPPVGGDTVYANMEAAWARLSDPIKRMLEPLSAVHSASAAYDPRTTGDEKYTGEAAITYKFDKDVIYGEVVHPVVRTHPETGRKSLYVNAMFTQRIVGLSQPESDALLAMLYDVSTRPELTCRIRWEDGTIAIWDNRWLQHYAIDDYADYERLMYRITITGERPV